MTNLSPAAEAVLNAVTLNRYDAPYYACPKSIGQIKSDVAAALRAAADQVVPEEPEPNPLKAWSVEDWNHMNITKYQREECRRQLLAIADELETQ
jgi:hypothetical protein